MRRIQNILFALGLILAFNIGYANTNGEEKKSNNQEQEGRRKADQSMMRPDGDIASQSSQGYQQEPVNESQNAVEELGNLMIIEERADSVEDESVSKYNFIFYFLYKFKYDAEEAP